MSTSTPPREMSAEEVRVLLRRIRGSEPSGATAEAWRQGLTGCSMGECEAALATLGPNNARSTSPSQIVGIIEAARARTPDPTPAPRRATAAERERFAAAGQRGMRRLYDQMGWRRSPNADAARQVACPFCRARPGRPCSPLLRDRRGRFERRDTQTRMHPSRIRAAHHETNTEGAHQ